MFLTHRQRRRIACRLNAVPLAWQILIGLPIGYAAGALLRMVFS